MAKNYRGTSVLLDGRPIDRPPPPPAGPQPHPLLGAQTYQPAVMPSPRVSPVQPGPRTTAATGAAGIPQIINTIAGSYLDARDASRVISANQLYDLYKGYHATKPIYDIQGNHGVRILEYPSMRDTGIEFWKMPLHSGDRYNGYSRAYYYAPDGRRSVWNGRDWDGPVRPKPEIQIDSPAVRGIGRPLDLNQPLPRR